MDWNRIEGDWKQYRGKAKEKWGKLTDDDLTRVSGKRAQLEGVIQNRYGYSIDQAKSAVAEWTDHLSQQAEQLASSAYQVADNLGTAVEKSVRDQPMTALAMAVLLGFVLGALWKS